jgi:hypothetical protein
MGSNEASSCLRSAPCFVRYGVWIIVVTTVYIL